MSQMQKCPMCEGRGVVPNGFYRSLPGMVYESSSLTPEQCRTCKGDGMVLMKNEGFEVTIKNGWPLNAAPQVTILRGVPLNLTGPTQHGPNCSG